MLGVLLVSCGQFEEQKSEVKMIRTIHHNYKEECKKDKNDPFEVGAIIFKGQSKGLCVEDLNKNVRPVFKLTPQEIKDYGFSFSEDFVYISNINHLDGFYVAKIPLNDIEKVIFQEEHFKRDVISEKLPISHAQMRIIFSQPVEMVSQVKNTTSKRIMVKDLVLSAQGVAGRGFSYDPIQGGFDGSTLNIYGVFTLDYKKNHSLVEQDNKIKQYELNMTQEEKMNYVKEWIRISELKSTSETYHILNTNCGTSQFYVLDRSVKYTEQEKKKISSFKGKMNSKTPSFSKYSLEIRGLFKEELSLLTR